MRLKLHTAVLAAAAALILFPVALHVEAEEGAPAAPATPAAASYGAWGIDLDGMDRSVKPGDDFFRFVNGKWADSTTIPPDKTRYGAFEMLRDESEIRVRAIIERWAADESRKPGSDEAKVAAIYRTFLDEAKVEELGRKPIDPKLEAIRGAENHEQVAALMAKGHGGFGRSLFGAAVFDDAKDPERYALYLSQSGLGLPDREFYLRENFKAQKDRYQQFVADMLRLAGWDQPDENAAAIVALETQIAEAHWTRAESRDRDKTYNPATVAELEKNAAGFPWSLYFKEAGLDKAERAVVRQNTALPKLAKIYADTPVDTLKAWLAFHLTDDMAPMLSKTFVDTQWEFRQKFLNGAQEQRPRWKRAVNASEMALGEAIGRAYVAENFPPSRRP
jgi:putative endopeptidase